MKRLFWKEWSELRMIIVMSTLLMFLLTVGYIYYGYHDAPVVKKASADIFLPMYVLFCCLPAALCGASMVAPEIGSNTLQFLTMVPVSRHRIWWTKIAAALTVTFASDVAAALLMYLVYLIANRMQLLSPQGLNEYVVSQLELIAVVIAVTVPVFAVSAAATTLFDNTIVALFGVIVGLVGSIVEIWTVVNLLRTDQPVTTIVVAFLAICNIAICFNWSYKIFVHGETLRTSKRFKLMFDGSVDIVAIVVAAVISYAWLVS
jgi:ABC-type transport system involved in multi-copper enzyme maturation permease subunit